MAFSPKPLSEEDVKAIRDFAGGIHKGAKQFSISERRYKLIHDAPSLEEAVTLARPKAVSNKDNGHETDVSLSEVKVKGAPVRFRIKDEEIALLADDLFTCYFIYLDMKKRLNLTSSFSESLTTAMKTTWSLTQEPEVTDGGDVKNAEFR